MQEICHSNLHDGTGYEIRPRESQLCRKSGLDHELRRSINQTMVSINTLVLGTPPPMKTSESQTEHSAGGAKTPSPSVFLWR